MIGIGVIAVILILGIVFMVPNNSQSEVNPTTTSEKSNSVFGNKLSSIDDVLTKLSETFEVGEKEETYYQMIGAYDGTKVDVDGTKIEIYQYKDSQREAMTSAQDTLDTADNQIFIVDDAFLILVHSTNSDFLEGIKQSLK